MNAIARRLPAIAFVAVSAASCTAAAAADVRVAALADLSLEQLREIVVTSVTRSDQRLDRAAASVYVISADDIRRAGATTLPEALRLAPMLDVARADANQYAISARGFNNVLANKMLVLIDGRAVYSPLFSGVFWEAQEVRLAAIDRIEVVSGPSGALWGTNAVNGLIHVFTRPASQTQGLAADAHAGNRERGGSLRYGGQFADATHYRVYAKAYDRSHSELDSGAPVRDAADGVQLGFRADWSGADDRLTLQGDAYAGTIDQLPQPREIGGANLLARWQRSFGSDAQATVQLYWDRSTREQLPVFEETLDTIDVVAQFGLRAGERHRLLLGAGARQADDDTENGAALAFVPADRKLTWWRLFAQDQLSLGEDLELTLSASVERNPYTDVEVLPSVRLAWAANERHLLWGALSRAVRAPSRIDRELFTPAQPPFLLAGGPDFRAEVSDVLELGLRAQPLPALSYAVTLFHHEHSKLRSLTPTAAGAQWQNNIEGSTEGVEAWAQWRVLDRWRLSAGIVSLHQNLDVAAGAVDAGGINSLGNDPREWWSLRSSLDVTPAWSWDVGLRHVGARPNPNVPAYHRVDTRFGWRPLDGLELALAIDNLLDRGHPEWGIAGNRVEHERALSLQLRWRLR